MRVVGERAVLDNLLVRPVTVSWNSDKFSGFETLWDPPKSITIRYSIQYIITRLTLTLSGTCSLSASGNHRENRSTIFFGVNNDDLSSVSCSSAMIDHANR